MKKRLILTTIMVYHFLSCSFGAVPFDDWAIFPRWDYISYSWEGHIYFREIYSVSGTEELHGRTYHALSFTRGYSFINYEEPVEMRYPPRTQTTIGIREENGRVLVDREQYESLLSSDSYWRFEGDSSNIPYPVTQDDELVLYDFSKQEGDVYCSLPSGDVIVSAVGHVITEDNISRRQLTLSNGMKLVEGIGCLNSCGHLLFYLNPADSPYKWGWLDSYSCNGNEVLSQSRADIQAEILQYLDSIKASVGNIPCVVRNASLYDLQGRRIAAKPRSGLYLKDGKKYIAR